MKPLTILLFIALFSSTLFAQVDETDYKRLIFGEQEEIFSGIALLPIDNSIIAVSGTRNCPLYIYNWKEEKVVNKFDVVDWKAGSAVSYSPHGKYILLEKLFYNDWKPNKDKKTEFYIYDANSGKELSRFDDYNAMKFMPGGEKVLSLTGEKLEIWNINPKKLVKSVKVDNAGNCAAISPNGKLIAISAKYDKKALKKSGKFKKNKDGLKHTVKTKNKVVVYDAESLRETRTVDTYFDFIYDLNFSRNGKELFCLQIPHTKASTGADRRQNTISIVKTNNWSPIRKGFVSRAVRQPVYELTSNRKYFGFISNSGGGGLAGYPELLVYDYNAAKMFNRFTLSHRIVETSKGRMMRVDERSRFVFLPDNETAIITMGNSLIKWKFVK